MSKIYGNVAGGFGFPKTYILTDENGTELAMGVYVDKETIFTATDNDVRDGFVYAGNEGIKTGTKKIPSYNTAQGSRYVPSGSTFSIPLAELDMYDYTQLQALICRFNTSMSNSVCTEKVSISDFVYNVSSTEVLANVVKDPETKTISFEITNDEDVPFVIKYFTYKEIL